MNHCDFEKGYIKYFAKVYSEKEHLKLNYEACNQLKLENGVKKMFEEDFTFAKVIVISDEKFDISGVESIESNQSDEKIIESLSDSDLIFIVDDKNLKRISDLTKDSKALVIAIIENEEKISDVNAPTFFVVKNKLNRKKIIRAISDLISTPNLVNLDIDDVKDIFEGTGKSYFATSEATGKNAVVEAIKTAINSPPFEKNIQNAQKFLLNITGSTDSLSMMEVTKASTTIQEVIHPEAEIIWGMSTDESLGDTIQVTILAAKTITKIEI